MAFGDVDQHVHRAGKSARGIEKWRRISNERNARAIRPLRDGLHAADRPLLLQRQCHRALVMRQRRAVGPIELPGPTEFALADIRAHPPKLHGCLIVGSNPSGGVRRVYRSRQGLQKLLGVPLSFVQMKLGRLLLGPFAKDVHRADDTAGTVFDRFDVHQRNDARTVRALDRDLLIAYSMAACENVGHGTLRVGYESPVEAVKAIGAAETSRGIADRRGAAP